MNIRKLIAGAATALLVGGGLALATAIPASAHVPEVTATCTAINVNLTQYAPRVPATEAVYKDVKVIDVQAAPAVYQDVTVIDSAAVPAVPATYVQEWKYVQHRHGDQFKWMPEGWNGIVHGVDHGNGWHYVQPEQHRDSSTVLTPAVAAIPEVSHVEPQLVTPSVAEVSHIEPQLVTPATPDKSNHLQVYVDGTLQGDVSFGTHTNFAFNYSGEVEHTWRVVVTALDDTRWNVDQSGTTTPCVVTPTQPEVKVTYSDWADSEIVCGDTSVDQNRTKTTEGYKLVDNEWVLDESTITTEQETQTRELTAQEIKDNACPVVIPPKPEAIVTVSHVDKTICDSSTVETTTITNTTDWVYNEETNTWYEGPQTSSEPVVTTRTATDAELSEAECAVVVPPVVVPPVVQPPAVTPVVPEKPAPAVDQRNVRAMAGQELAVTGEQLPLAAGLIALALMAAGIGFFTVAGIRRRNKA